MLSASGLPGPSYEKIYTIVVAVELAVLPVKLAEL